MSSEPLVSVVVPVHNREQLIARCIASIQQQTCEDWEAVVVDDGSQDGTAAVVELACRDPRIRLIRLPTNRGAQVARNAGIRAARGEWVAFLDSDDQLLPTSFEARLETAKASGADVIYSGCLALQPDGSTRPYRSRPIYGHVYTTLLRGEGPAFPSLLVRRSVLERIALLDERIVAFQEWDTAIRLARHHRFGFTDVPTFIYDRTQADSISRNWIRGARGYEQIIDKHRLPMLWYGGPRVLAHHYRNASWWYQQGAARGAARRCTILATLWAAGDLRTPLGRLRRLTRRWSGSA